MYAPTTKCAEQAGLVSATNMTTIVAIGWWWVCNTPRARVRRAAHVPGGIPIGVRRN